MCRYARISGTIPTMPNDMSIGIQNNGMPRSGPQIAARGITSTHAIIPNWTTHLLRTGSRIGPAKATAMVMWPKASQSVP